MSDHSSNLSLPYIIAAQSQKHVTHNEALRALDAVVQIGVISGDLAAPPDHPTEGDRYIVAAFPSGAWAEQAGKIAAWQDGAWAFYAPREGWLAWIAAEARLYVYASGDWIINGLASVNPAPLIGVNATADASNRLSVSSPATLLNHEGAGHQLKINKAEAADTASILFQSGFSGRTEFGLTGDDDWHVKVSPDGATWHDSIVVDRSTGQIALPAGFSAPQSIMNRLGLYFRLVLNNNTAGMIDLEANQFGSMLLVFTNNIAFGKGLVWMRAATGPSFVTIATHADLGLYTGPLAGMTGADGRLNVSCDALGKYYFENRTGAGRNIYAFLFRDFGSY